MSPSFCVVLCCRQVALGKRNASTSSGEDCTPRTSSLMTSAREYVESLHQNNRSQLLYGKNNVIVQPVSEVTSSYSR